MWDPLQIYFEVDSRLTTITDALLLRITPQQWASQQYDPNEKSNIQPYTLMFDEIHLKNSRIQNFLLDAHKIQMEPGQSYETIDILAQVLLAGLDEETNGFIENIMQKRSEAVKNLKDRNKSENIVPENQSNSAQRYPERWIWDTLGLDYQKATDSDKYYMVKGMILISDPSKYKDNKYIGKIQEMYQSMDN